MWSHDNLEKFGLHFNKIYKHQTWWGGDLGLGTSTNKPHALLIMWSLDVPRQNNFVLYPVLQVVA